MKNRYRPSLPIPPPLRGSELNSFAYHTIRTRLPRIGRRVLAENDYPPQVVARLEQMLAELPDGEIRQLSDTAAPDTAQWIEYVSPYLGWSWLAVPWFFAETYFYRRILEATGYFQAGSNHPDDPFAPHKRQSLEENQKAIVELARRQESQRRAGWGEESLAVLLAGALWGNQGDLSMWPESDAERPEHSDSETARAHTLLDDRGMVSDHLRERTGVRVDFLIDNAGFELVSDLALIDYLLDSGRAAAVHLHLKAYPTFVSDTTLQDLEQVLEALSAAETAPVAAFGQQLRGYLEAGRIQLQDHDFWNSPLPGWEMPQDLYGTLAMSDLVISKGDAHYRRLLGDRHWARTAPFAQIVSYFPASLLALRILKSEVVSGLAPARLASLKREDPKWLTSGRWGLIQFAPASRSTS